MIKIRHILAALLLVGLSARAEMLSPDAHIELITCAPGDELYARYGHTALRVFDPVHELDITFNYGLFDFNTDHFYWRFIKGETYYMLGAEYTDSFLAEYAIDHRPVYSQTLCLSPEKTQQLFDALCINYLPENRTYLYNFVFDNCATRPYCLISQVLADSIRSSYTGNEGVTYRTFLTHYTGEYTWADFGINLLFGPRADRPMQGLDRIFLPEELMRYLSSATLSDGSPVVCDEHIGAFVPFTTPWYADCRFGLSLAALALALLTIYDRRRGHLTWPVDLVAGIVWGVVFAIVVFLTFFSIHPLVGFGWRLFAIPAVYLIIRSLYFIKQKK